MCRVESLLVGDAGSDVRLLIEAEEGERSGRLSDDEMREAGLLSWLDVGRDQPGLIAVGVGIRDCLEEGRSPISAVMVRRRSILAVVAAVGSFGLSFGNVRVDLSSTRLCTVWKGSGRDSVPPLIL